VTAPAGIERDALTGVVASSIAAFSGAAFSGAPDAVRALTIGFTGNPHDIARLMGRPASRGPRSRLGELFPPARGGMTVSSHAPA
jgi:hypothetical protein